MPLPTSWQIAAVTTAEDRTIPVVADWAALFACQRCFKAFLAGGITYDALRDSIVGAYKTGHGWRCRHCATVTMRLTPAMDADRFGFLLLVALAKFVKPVDLDDSEAQT